MEDKPIIHPDWLQGLAVEHPYYTSDSNFYSNEASNSYRTVTEFLSDYADTDVDMNLCTRFDIYAREDGTYRVQLLLILQRKGIYRPIHIESITAEEVSPLKAYLEKHWETLKNNWQPISTK